MMASIIHILHTQTQLEQWLQPIRCNVSGVMYGAISFSKRNNYINTQPCNNKLRQ